MSHEFAGQMYRWRNGGKYWLTDWMIFHQSLGRFEVHLMITFLVLIAAEGRRSEFCIWNCFGITVTKICHS